VISAYRRAVSTLAILLSIATASPAAGGGTPAKKPVKKAAQKPVEPQPDNAVPDLGRYFDTWLWVKSEGLMAVSSPETKGAARTLTLNPDMSYEFHQRRDTRDSVLCKGTFYFSEETLKGSEPSDFLDFGGWHEPYEHRMTVDFSGRDTLFLVGDNCDNCPEHMFVRGKSAIFEGTVKAGQPFRHDLWDGLRFELDPVELGWRIAIRDTARPDQDLASLTPPYHFAPNPKDIEGWHFRNKANTGPNKGDVNAPQEVRDFIFSPEVGTTIQGPEKGTASITVEDVERVTNRGRGVLEIQEMTLTPAAKDQQAGITSMRFRVAIEEAHR